MYKYNKYNIFHLEYRRRCFNFHNNYNKYNNTIIVIIIILILVICSCSSSTDFVNIYIICIKINILPNNWLIVFIFVCMQLAGT